MKKALILIIALILVSSVILTGTGCKTTTSDIESTITEAVTAEAEVTETEKTEAEASETTEDIWGTDPISIDLWTWQTNPGYIGEDGFYDYIATEYNKLHPNITINWQFSEITSGGYVEALKAAIAGNETPDMFGVHPGAMYYEFVDSGVMYDITDVVNNDTEWSSWLGTSKDLVDFWYNDRMYMVPQGVGIRGIYYWKEMWPNGFPTTQSELYKEAARLNGEGLIPMAFAGTLYVEYTEAFIALVGQMDPEKTMIEKAEAGEIKWVNDTFLKACDTIGEMAKQGVFPEGFVSWQYAEDALESFMTKKSASFWIGGQWWMSEFAAKLESDLIEDNIGWAFFPAVDGYEPCALGGGAATMAVDPEGENLEIALDILKFTNSPGAQEVMFNTMADIPPGGHLFMDKEPPYPLFGLLTELRSTTDLQKYWIDDPDIQDALYNELLKVSLGEKTSEEALNAIQAVTDEVLNK